MNPTLSETADLLERAADLYESEQIDWCRGSWGTSINYIGIDTAAHGQFHCAEGALLRAAGFSLEQIEASQHRLSGEAADVCKLLATPVVWAGIEAVNSHLGHYVGPRLYHYNDQLAARFAKQTLIQAFKETAKDLRNGS